MLKLYSNPFYIIFLLCSLQLYQMAKVFGPGEADKHFNCHGRHHKYHYHTIEEVPPEEETPAARISTLIAAMLELLKSKRTKLYNNCT